MYNLPEEFEERFKREFGDRLRIRWSEQHGEWVVEQKFRRIQTHKADDWDDNAIRMRDGYLFVMSIRQGTRMPCKRCSTTLAVPIRESRLVSCPYCKLKGYPHHHAASYFPFDDSLIEHLQRLDPTKDAWRRLQRDADKANIAMVESQRRYALGQGDAALNFDYDRIVGIPKVGLSGSTKAWADGKESKTEAQRLTK